MQQETSRTSAAAPARKRRLALVQPAASAMEGENGLSQALAEAQANTRAVVEVIDAIGRETTATGVLESSLRTVKQAFHLDYGACWMIDRAIQATSYRMETNSLGPAFDAINEGAHFQKGQGITGRTWASADVVFVPDLSVIKESKLVDTARAAGAVAAVSFPFIVQDEVAGVLFFLAFKSIHPSPDRLAVLNKIGRLIGQAFKRLLDLEREVAEREALRVDAEDILTIVRAAQQGDLTRAMPQCSDRAMQQVSQGLGLFLENLRSSLHSITATASSLTASAEQLNGMSGAMQARARETSANAAAATQASLEVSQNIQSISTGSSGMVASIRELSGNAKQSSVKFQDAVRLADAARHMMAKLSASGKDIEAIVKVVNSIARETNLLALNAAIEAARAGVAGRTFMVVSNEVKELAREAASATERIREKIAVIQQDTARAVDSIAAITNVVSEVSQIAGIIAHTAEEQAMTTSEIGRHVNDAAAGSSSIAEKIGEVAKVAHGAQQEAAETQAAARSLSSIAAELHTLVSRFRVD